APPQAASTMLAITSKPNKTNKRFRNMFFSSKKKIKGVDLRTQHKRTGHLYFFLLHHLLYKI
ncbi:MAG: hypothetical protein Q8L87_07915, partial [Anaerolineales bacterium]|nr:hypothetical protein [Anaerolineales bacterium]